ncbi:MAG: peptide ABC transporter substrate-binding protein [Oceanicaulis sp.]
MRGSVWISLAALALAGCSPADDSGEIVLHRGNELEPLTLDPQLAHITNERQIVLDLFTGLYEPDREGRPVLALAQSAQISEDALSWTFTLREARWSDGHPITAEDVEAGLRRALDPATRNPYPAVLFVIENAQAVAEGAAPVETLGVEALDPRTVTIRLEHPAPYLPSILAVWGSPAPSHVVVEHGEDWIRPETMVVSGAYDLVRWRSNDFIELTRNPHFFDAEAVCADRVFYYPTVDTGAAERRVRNGELDLNTNFNGANLALLRERHPALVRIDPGLVVRSISFNTRSEVGGDARVRTALGMAIDRDFIAEEVLGGADEAASRRVPQGVSGRLEGPELSYAQTPMEARRAAARALLAEAGYGPDNPLEVTLHYQPSSGWPRVAPVIQEDWSLIADWVRPQILSRDSQLHYDAMRSGDYIAATTGWVGDFNDPYAYLLQYGADAGEINHARWEDAAYTQLVRAARDNPDAEARRAQLAQAETLFLDGGAATPIFIERAKSLVRPEVEGWGNSAWGINLSRWLCKAQPED